MKNIKIEIPEGYQIDQEKSTFENIVFKEIVKPEFQVGDCVKIILPDRRYIAFVEMAKKMNFDLSHVLVQRGDVGCIFDIQINPVYNDFVYGVETMQGKILMCSSGLTLSTQEEKEDHLKGFTKGNDWFTVFLTSNRKMICKGDIFNGKSCNHFSVTTHNKYLNEVLFTIGDISFILKSTQEEVSLVRNEAPEWFENNYKVGDFVVAISDSKVKYIGIYTGKINSKIDVLRQFLVGGMYFTDFNCIPLNILRKANEEEIKMWLNNASDYYNNRQSY